MHHATFLTKTQKSPRLQEPLPPEDNQVKEIAEKLQFRTCARTAAASCKLGSKVSGTT